ncbi:MAG TPA: Gfo/Idh/MocA family oxidoreductase [Acidobacteriota bacterium]|jgi:predicted dehydrogenase|nr:Gfo/Idh/MocA family oxidoreductase [Acidobacteriota bacterium]
MKPIDRREFVKIGAAGLATAASLRHATGANDKIAVGVIGYGRQGVTNTRDFFKQPEVVIAAVCDVYEPHLNKAASDAKDKGHNPESYKDFRRVLDRKEIDAVIISSPDHWHALQAVMACDSGKDVYVEKPIATTIAEGRKMVDAARKNKRVVQVGTQQRSAEHFQKAAELVRSGAIGQVSEVRTWNLGNQFPDGMGYAADSDPPPDLDWDMWLGPAPKVPFNKNKFGVRPDGFSTFRWFWDYAGGMMTDWGVHWIDIVQWAMDVDGPDRIAAAGGKFGLKDNRDTPDTFEVIYQYPTWVLTYSNRELSGRGPIISEATGLKGGGITFHGTKGTLFVDRQGFEVIPERRRITRERAGEALMEPMSMKGTERHEQHVRNFIDCMKSRQNPISDIEIGHRSTSTCHLGNIAYRTRREIVWNVKEEKIESDKDANRYLDREYRKPWRL